MFLTTSMLFAVVLYAAIGAEAGCPADIRCKNDNIPCASGHETASYVKAEDGTECPACTHCLDSDKYCPDMNCPNLLDSSDCEGTSTLYVKVNGKECTACDVATC